MSIEIGIRVEHHLLTTLIHNKVLLCDYKPAYNGESVGLDLFNAGSDIVIPPAISEDILGLDRTQWSSFTESSREDSTLITQKIKKARFKTLIPTGLKIALPSNYVALLKERGSVTKSPFILRAGVIDPGYTGEIFVNMVNISDDAITIKAHEKLPVQLIVMQTCTNFKILTSDEYNSFTQTALRKAGKVGSSN